NSPSEISKYYLEQEPRNCRVQTLSELLVKTNVKMAIIDEIGGSRSQSINKMIDVPEHVMSIDEVE
ncbi:16364_t:CDS:2, partial [Funneliformis caledonium]